MKHVCFSLTVLLLGLSGCSEASLVGSESNDQDRTFDNLAMSKNTDHYVPITISRTTSSSTWGEVPPNDVFPFEMGVTCTQDTDYDPFEIELWMATEGQNWHLGATKTYTNFCVDFAPQPWALRGKSIWVAANGDQIFLDFAGDCTQVNACDEFVAYLTVTGGTGRFENAHTPPGEPLVETNGEIVGLISSVGSSK